MISDLADVTKKGPLVTLGIPAYNEARTIGVALASLIESSESSDKSFEVIIATSGCTDSTVPTARAVANRAHPDLTLLVLDEPSRGGKARALNQIVSHARGDFVIFCDADVLVDTHAVAALLEAFHSRPSVGVVYAQPRFASIHNKLLARVVADSAAALDAIRRGTAAVGTLLVSGHLYGIRRSSWQPIPEYIVSEDPYLGLSANARGWAVAYVPDAVVHVVPPQNIPDYFRQKVRNRLGRIQLKELFPQFAVPKFYGLHLALNGGIRSRQWPAVAADTLVSTAATLQWWCGHRATPLWKQVTSTKDPQFISRDSPARDSARS